VAKAAPAVQVLEPFAEDDPAAEEALLGDFPEGLEAFGCHPPDGSYVGEAGGFWEEDPLPATIAPLDAAPAAQLVQFTVKTGDTVTGLAGVFGISPETIRWANDLDGQEDTLRVGQVLTILPVSGVLHEVVSGDSVAAIASAYGVEAGSIIAANGLLDPDTITAGQRLVIPGGEPLPG
jgi:LysM repeat protein